MTILLLVLLVVVGGVFLNLQKDNSSSEINETANSTIDSGFILLWGLGIAGTITTAILIFNIVKKWYNG